MMSLKMWTHLLLMPDYKTGDPAPEGYLQWHAWADIQMKAGVRQTHCDRCGKWHFPQEVKKSCGKQITGKEFNAMARRAEKQEP